MLDVLYAILVAPVKDMAGAPAFWIVGLNLLLAAYDDFLAIADTYRDRRAPSRVGVPRRPPHVAPRSRIEGGNEGSAVLVLIQDDAVSIQKR